MDFQFGEKEEALREEIREFVRENLPSGHIHCMFEDEHSDELWEFSMSMARKLARKRWLTMAWPREYGGMEASVWEQLVYKEEVGYWGIPGTRMGVGGVEWVGPSLIQYGSEEQKEKYLPLIASGDPDGVWCTGYSEPEAGSDFANLKTRAERKGEGYIINGQKIWTSAAHRSRWCWLAARTNPGAEKKHEGISILIVDMKSEGITVRPIKNYIGYHLFNEVFFTDVKVPAANLVGEEDRGWNQLMHSLGFEREIAVASSASARRILDELVSYAKETGIIRRPEIRQRLADMAVDIESLKVLAYETAWKMHQGMNTVYEPARDYAYTDLIHERISEMGTEILGAYSQVNPLNKSSRWTRLNGAVEHLYWMFPGVAIGGGTTDTLRNIVGQHGLGLPRSY